MATTDTIYTYSGPLSGVTLEDGREVMLHPGADVPLPANNPYVKRLVAKKWLTEVPAAPAAKSRTETRKQEGGENAS